MNNYAKLPRGHRLVRVFDGDTGEVILSYASYQDLETQLNFSKNDLKNLPRVLSGEVPRIKGYRVENLGILRGQ